MDSILAFGVFQLQTYWGRAPHRVWDRASRTSRMALWVSLEPNTMIGYLSNCPISSTQNLSFHDYWYFPIYSVPLESIVIESNSLLVSPRLATLLSKPYFLCCKACMYSFSDSYRQMDFFCSTNRSCIISETMFMQIHFVKWGSELQWIQFWI